MGLRDRRRPIVAYYQQPNSLGIASQITATAASGAGTRSVTFTSSTVATSVPASDNFEQAQLITGHNGTTIARTPGATHESGEPNHGNRPCATSVWFRWIAPATESVAFTTAGSSFDTLCAVYTGSDVSALTKVAANDNDPTMSEWSMTSMLTFKATQGTEYYIAVDGFRGQVGKAFLAWVSGGGPANDYFEDRQSLSGDAGNVTGSNVGATKEPNEPSHSAGTGTTTVWYTLQPTVAEKIAVSSAGSDFDTVCAIYTGANLGALVLVGANDDEILDQIETSKVVFQARAGVQYHIAITGYSRSSGNIALSWSPPVPPSNDNFAEATLIAGADGEVTGENLLASKEDGEPDHANIPGGRSVWYAWEAPTDGGFTFDTFQSTFDTLLAVYSGSGLSALAEIGSNDDSGSLQSSVSFTATAGTTYRIAIDGYGGATGNIELHWHAGGALAPSATLGAFSDSPASNGKSSTSASSQQLSLPQNTDVTPETFAALAAAGKECDDPAGANRGEAGHWQTVDGKATFATSRTILVGLPKTATSPPCPHSINIEHKIVTVNTPRARNLPGKLTLKLKSGDASIIDIKHNGAPYTLGTPVAVLETGHSGCGIHTWHYGEEPFEFFGKTKGTVVLEAEVDPDPDDGGDGQPTQKLTITVNVIKITYTTDPEPNAAGIAAKTSWGDQEVESREQEIVVTTDPPGFADQLTLELKEFDPQYHEEYTPDELGGLTQDSSDATKWKYVAFEEARTEKHPVEKRVIVTAKYDDVEVCPPLLLSVRSVFGWLTERHRHGPGGQFHNMPDSPDYNKAIGYVRWKYKLKLGNLRSVAYSATLSDDGEVFWGGGVGNKDCLLGTAAFHGRTDSTHAENWCASVMIHENVHGAQNTGNKLWQKWYWIWHCQHDHDLEFELPAYQVQLESADDVGLPKSDKDEIQEIIDRVNGGGTVGQ